MICCLSLFSQTIKYEMRGNWLATVYQLNWPPSYATITSPNDEVNIKKQKDAMIKMLDGFVEANQNVVFFQVRSRCDAMYKSSYEPWSSDLVTTRGMDPGYDPLQFVVEEGHKRGLEIHAWVNPYRFESSAGQWSGMAGDYASSTDWVIQVNNATILNPGKPEVRDRITAVIEEIVSNYDVDGIVFDDYFYLQGIKDQDAKEQALYNTEGLPVADWRRSNVNKMIAQVNAMIQRTKPYVRFGVSPAGIWGGSAEAAFKYGVTQPVGIGSGYAYNGIYCDPLAWLDEGAIDYVSPQIYWTTGSGSTDYVVLSEWWSNIGRQFSRHFYSSQSISSLDPWLSAIPRKIQIQNKEIPSEGLSALEYTISQDLDVETTRATTSFGYAEIGSQIDCNRLYDCNNAPGSIFYSAQKFLNTKGFIPYLVENHFKYRALPPAIFWKSRVPVQMVSDLTLADNQLQWHNGGDKNVRYVIYAVPVSESLSRIYDAAYLCGLSYKESFELPAGISAASHHIGVSVLDRYSNESSIAILNKTVGSAAPVDLISPTNNASVVFPTTFSWSAIPETAAYRLEIAENPDFNPIVAMRITEASSVDTENLFPIKTGKEYYWRVVSLIPGNNAGISQTGRFNSFDFRILSPADSSENISLTPVIEWVRWSEATNYLLEISTSKLFDNNIIFSRYLTETSFKMPEEVLVSNSSYYIRITSTNGNITIKTPLISIRTAELVPEIPTIIAPEHESNINTGKISVLIDKNPNASGFRYELSQIESFPPRSTNIKSVNAFNYNLEYDLTPGTYYSRVRANYGTKYTDWSKVVKFTVTTIDGVTNINTDADFYINAEANTHYLHLPTGYENGSSIQIFNSTGKLIAMQLLTLSNNRIIDLYTGHYEKGAYILIMKSGSDIKTLKFFK